MKVRDLIQALQQKDPDLEVHVAYDYGDHWHTTVAPKVRRVEETGVMHSEYHRMPKVVDDGDEDAKDMTQAVVLFTKTF
jgi:hypothetical protein